MKMKRFLMAGLVVMGLIGLSACKKEKPAEEEVGELEELLPDILPYMTAEGREVVQAEPACSITTWRAAW